MPHWRSPCYAWPMRWRSAPMTAECSTSGAQPSCCAPMMLARRWCAARALLLPLLMIPACAPTFAPSPPGRTDATIYLAEDGRELLPLRLSPSGWQALEAADPRAAHDLDRINLIAICVTGLGASDKATRDSLCNARSDSKFSE